MDLNRIKTLFHIKIQKILIENIPKLIDNYSLLKENMHPYITEVKNMYTKQNQWEQFKKIVNENS